MKNLKQIKGVWLPDSDTHFKGYILNNQEYQERNIKNSLAYVQKFRGFIDVGAHCGLIAKQLAPLFERGICIEPQKIAFECLKLNLQGYNAITCLNKGASDAKGHIRLLGEGEENSGAVWSFKCDESPVSVEAITLDSLNVSDIDFIKIDVEGMETDILKGARDLLQKCRPVLHVEQNKDKIKDFDFFHVCKDFGYRMIKRTGKDCTFVPVEHPAAL